MTIELFDSVSLAHPIMTMREDGEGGITLEEGARGAVVMVYGEHEGYEVEFMDGEYTIALLTLSAQDIRLAERHRPGNTYTEVSVTTVHVTERATDTTRRDHSVSRDTIPERR